MPVFLKRLTFFALFLALSLAIASAWPACAKESRSLTLIEAGKPRTYALYRPASLNRLRPVPLVIMLHGGFGSGRQAENAYRWDEKADQEGFVVAYPDGIGHSWNAGGTCCGPANRDRIDDVAFLTRLIAHLVKAEHIDPRKVYLAGMSNGAAMAYRYGCQGPYPLAALGSVAGTLAFSCPRPGAIPVMEIHGLADRHVPFEGGQGEKARVDVIWRPVQETLDSFRSANGCDPEPLVRATSKEGARTTTWSCHGLPKVSLITIDGAGHQWPGSVARRALIARLLQIDEPSAALDATSTLWDFFSQQTAALPNVH